MRDLLLVIPSRADGEGPHRRGEIDPETLSRSTEAEMMEMAGFSLCDLRAIVRSFAVCAAQDDNVTNRRK